MKNLDRKQMKNPINENEKNKDNDYFISQNQILFKKYHLIKLIGIGTFSKVYSGLNLINNSYVAIKAEKRSYYGVQLLESEAFFLYSLRGYGIPEVLSYGKTKTHNVLVMPLLGKSLLEKFIIKNKTVNINDICSVAIQILDRIEWIHSNNIVYRDIKPENFLFGKKDSHVLYLIDFGLCKKFKSSKTGKHIEPRNIGKFTGTSRYASVNAISGNEQSRRDDIESIGYMIIFFMKKKLPWQNIKGDSYKEYYHKLYLMKKNIKIEDLCNGLPREIAYYMKYSTALKFEQEPNYKYLKNLFKIILKRNDIIYEKYILSWYQTDLMNYMEKRNLIYKGNSSSKIERKSSPQKRLFVQIQKSIENKNKKIVNTSNNKESEKSLKNGYNIISRHDNSIKSKNDLNSEISNSLKVIINKNISNVSNELNIINTTTINSENFDTNTNNTNNNNITNNNNNINKNNNLTSIRNNRYKNDKMDLKNNFSLVLIKNRFNSFKDNKNSKSYENNKINKEIMPISQKVKNKIRNTINISPYSHKSNKNLDNSNSINKNYQKKYNTINQIEIDNQKINKKNIKNSTIKFNNTNINNVYNRYSTFNIFNLYNNNIDNYINNNIIINNIYQRFLGNINNNVNCINMKKKNKNNFNKNKYIKEKLINLMDIGTIPENNGKNINTMLKKPSKNPIISDDLNQNTINSYTFFNNYKKNILKKNDNNSNLTNFIFNTEPNKTIQNTSSAFNTINYSNVDSNNKINLNNKKNKLNNNNINKNKMNNINQKILKTSEKKIIKENKNININKIFDYNEKIKKTFNINNNNNVNSKNSLNNINSINRINMINNIININVKNKNNLNKIRKNPNLYDKEININENVSLMNSNNISYNNKAYNIDINRNISNHFYGDKYHTLEQEKNLTKNISPTQQHSSKDKIMQYSSIFNNYIYDINRNNNQNIENSNKYNNFRNMSLNQNKDSKEIPHYSSNNVKEPKKNTNIENENKNKILKNQYYNNINLNYERKFKTEEVDIKFTKKKINEKKF